MKQTNKRFILRFQPVLRAGNQGTLDKILASSMFDNDTFFIALSENQSNERLREKMNYPSVIQRFLSAYLRTA